ncbi:MAG: hypothetical protein ACTHMB_28120 [Candidatus Binatia bacterium]
MMVFTATTGPELPQSSHHGDFIITYVDQWMWDITLYLLELTVLLGNKTPTERSMKSGRKD